MCFRKTLQKSHGKAAHLYARNAGRIRKKLRINVMPSAATQNQQSGNQNVRDTRTYGVGATLLPMSTCGNRAKHKTNISCTNSRDSGNNRDHTNDCNYTKDVRPLCLREKYTQLEGANSSCVISVPSCTDCAFSHFNQLIRSVCCINWVC